MRIVRANITIQAEIHLPTDMDVDEVINEADYNITSTTNLCRVHQTQMTDFEVLPEAHVQPH